MKGTQLSPFALRYAVGVGKQGVGKEYVDGDAVAAADVQRPQILCKRAHGLCSLFI